MSRRVQILLAVFAAGIAGLGGYIYYKKAAASGSTLAGIASDAPVASARQIFFRYNGVDANYGKLGYVQPANPAQVRFIDTLSCEVVYVSHGRGICMTALRGVVTTYTARIFDASSFDVYAELVLKGIPSRARVSSDGKLGAMTVFVTGHGYTSLDFSTQTLIVDMATGRVLADLETFEVSRDSEIIKKADFNFWGVTFAANPNLFFATLSSGGAHFLIQGDIEKRSARVVRDNVECPSLSPDGRRIAYKKRYVADGRIGWKLHVFELAEERDIELPEQRSIDDQLEWLDANSVLYSVPETAADVTPSTDVWVAAVDGSRPPRLYLHKAYSPAVVRDTAADHGVTKTTSTQ